MLARCLPTVQPPLDEHEALETTAIYSAAGKLDGVSLLSTRPFRSPHHDVSIAGLVGGGPVPRPGEISLAHHGVLFLDELPEFKRPVLEALRQPLEDRRVTIVRARAALTYPASFSLVAAMNPCPCGYRGSSLRSCICSEERVRRYLGRLSGPLLDRIDLHIEVPHIDYRALRAERDGEDSHSVRERVLAARAIQKRRLHGTGRHANAELGPRQLREHCQLDAQCDNHLETCVRRLGLSGRAVHRILRVARTVADLAGRERLAPADLAEAIALRALDREVTA
jgi:magnesium chelatase family protein